MKKYIPWIMMALFAASTTWAHDTEIKAVGSYHYKGGVWIFTSKKPTEGEMTEALANAKINAWKKLVSSYSAAKQKMIADHEPDVIDHLESFIVQSPVVIDSSRNEETKTIEVVTRTTFNDDAVDQYLNTLVARSQSSGEARSSDSLFTFLFMSRKQSEIKQFDARKTIVQQAQVGASSSDGDDDSSNVSTTAKLVTGGNTSRKADAVTYTVSSSQDLDAAMGNVLTTAGIEYAGYDDVVASCNGVPKSEFANEFVNSDELTPSTRAQVIHAARECGVRYLAYGTVDTGVSDTDPVSGSKRVYVSVRSQLWDISKKLPRKIGSVGPKQYSDLGPDENVAGRNALSKAASDLARTLVDQLNAKGIR